MRLGLAPISTVLGLNQEVMISARRVIRHPLDWTFISSPSVGLPSGWVNGIDRVRRLVVTPN